MKVKAKDLTKETKQKTLDALDKAAASLSGKDALKLFLNDLLTESERIMLGRRILIARRLLQGESGRGVASDMKVGLDTVFKIEKWLDKKFPGYEEVVRHFNKEIDIDRKKKDSQKAWKDLKRKYPLHFLLFPD